MFNMEEFIEYLKKFSMEETDKRSCEECELNRNITLSNDEIDICSLLCAISIKLNE